MPEGVGYGEQDVLGMAQELFPDFESQAGLGSPAGEVAAELPTEVQGSLPGEIPEEAVVEIPEVITKAQEFKATYDTATVEDKLETIRLLLT